MNAPVTYTSLIDPFKSRDSAGKFGELLNAEVEWVQRGNTPRREAFYCKYPTDYFYGNVEYGRSYSANTNIPPRLKSIWDWLETQGVEYEACFLNKYEHAREHLGWHADDSDSIDDTRPIAVISFGAERELWFRKNPEKCFACNGSGRYDNTNSPKCGACDGTGREPAEPVERLLLESGSMCLMLPGMQDTHQHRIPKADREVSTRISLTFRGLVE